MLKNPYPGRFIVLEGPDGSGQTTQAELLKGYFEDNGREVVMTKEPTTASEAGRRIREVLQMRESMDPFELQKLFAEDRREHLENSIIPALKCGKVVISDRYAFSSFAFGSVDSKLEDLMALNDSFLLPDFTFVLYVKPEVSIDRIARRGKHVELFEQVDKLRKVLETYTMLQKLFPNYHIIDGERRIEEVHQELKSYLFI